MFKNLFATLAGLFTGILIIAGVEMLGHTLYPPPQHLSEKDSAAWEAYMQTAPLGAILFILLAWALGSFCAGIVSSLIKRDSSKPALLCGTLLLFSGIFNLVSFSHPIWFWPAIAFIFIPMAWLGFWIVNKKRE